MKMFYANNNLIKYETVKGRPHKYNISNSIVCNGKINLKRTLMIGNKRVKKILLEND